MQNKIVLRLIFVIALISPLTLVFADDDADGPEVREYWIVAEKVLWDYAPSKMNKIKPTDGLGVWGQTRVYEKYRYIQTGPDFKNKIEQPEWMGILGPQLHVVEGETLKVHFRNDADKPLSIHPHGVRYDQNNDGADFDFTERPGAKVAPGDTYTYIWKADAHAAPGPSDPSSIVWVYHSHVDSVEEIYDGLIGTIVVTKKGKNRSRNDPRPADVDKEFTTLFMVFNEEDDEEGGLMHAMNGYIFGNLQGYEVNKGEKVRWYLVGMGTEVDMHTAHWHGQTVLFNGNRTDVVELLPTSMKTVDMRANNPGTWLYHCHVTDHITAGMMTRWVVNP